MTLLEILVLAIVQGLTEFLPVSSSGHLVVANAILESLGAAPARDLVESSIVLHLGTLASVLAYYRREVARLFGPDRHLLPMLVVGTIPAGIVGVGIKKGLPDSLQDAVLENPLLAGLMFPVTALILVIASRRSARAEGADAGAAASRPYQSVTWRDALAIGAWQAVAILPGVSRSGSTIAGGLVAGLDRGGASTFAFLLAIPAILGAGALESLEILERGASTPAGVLAVGFVVSFVVGLGALALLIRIVRRGRLGAFAWYLVPLGAAVVAWRLGWAA